VNQTQIVRVKDRWMGRAYSCRYLAGEVWIEQYRSTSWFRCAAYRVMWAVCGRPLNFWVNGRLIQALVWPAIRWPGRMPWPVEYVDLHAWFYCFWAFCFEVRVWRHPCPQRRDLEMNPP